MRSRNVLPLIVAAAILVLPGCKKEQPANQGMSDSVSTDTTPMMMQQDTTPSMMNDSVSTDTTPM